MTTKFIEVGDSYTTTEELLGKTIISSINFQGLPLTEAIDHLAKQLNPTGEGQRVITISILGAAEANHPMDTEIHLRLTNVSVAKALRYTTALAERTYTITEEGNITIAPKSAPDGDLVTNAFFLHGDFLSSGGKAYESAKNRLEEHGIEFPTGASAIFVEKRNKLIIRNTKRQMDAVEAFLQKEDLQRAALLKEIIARWEEPQNPSLTALEETLKTTILPSINFNDVPIFDALQRIQQQSVLHSSDKVGINIIIRAQDSIENIGSTPITLSLTNIPLTEALRYTTSLAGMTYEVETHAIVVRSAD
ncbi:MAG: hypothetical protein AAF191_20345 [Verrucomicrobiota bacterium]